MIRFLSVGVLLIAGVLQPVSALETGSEESWAMLEEGDIQTSRKPIEIPAVDPLFFIDGQLCQHLRRMLQDRSGNLWFGTNNYDIMHYNGDSLQYFHAADGVGKGRVTGILEDEDGNVWFGTYSGLTKYDGEKFTNFAVDDRINNNEIWSLTRGRDGTFWIGTMQGVSRFDGKTFTSFPVPKAAVEDPTIILAPERVPAILEDSRGNVWFAFDGFGITKWDGEIFTFLTTENGLPDNNVYDLFEDTRGDIWIGTMFGGLSRYDGEKFTNFTEKGLIDGIEVGGLYEDSRGHVWFAVENHGVYCYDGDNFKHYYKDHGLPTNGILCILEDRDGQFWFGGWGGLFRLIDDRFVSVTREGPWGD